MVWEAVPGLLWVVWAPTAAAILAALARTPVTGLRLTEDTLTLSPWQMPQVIPLDDVRCIRLQDWSQGADMEVLLRNGRAVRIQDCDLPPRADFVAALALREIRVEEI
jgi:hypothetical protein